RNGGYGSAGGTFKEAVGPIRGGDVFVSVEGVDSFVFGDYIDDIMHALARDVDICHHQWLTIHIAIHVVGEELAETVDVDVGEIEDGFVGVDAEARIAVVIAKHRDGRLRRGGARPQKGNADEKAG